MKEIAEACGFKTDYLYKLYQGHDCTRATGQLFHAEIQKISKKHEKEIKELLKENTFIALGVVNDVLKRHKALDYHSDDDVKVVSGIINAIAKLSPSVEITNNSFSYVKGLQTEELAHELNRLTSLARGSSNRGRVPEAGSRIAGAISDLPEPSRGDGEEPEDTDV